MKRISFWAKKHVALTRVLIVFIFILLNILGVFTGTMLLQNEVVLPEIAIGVSIVAFSIAWIFYPSKNKEKRYSSNDFYFKRKTFDFALAATTFCMLIYIGNKGGSPFLGYPHLSGATEISAILPVDSTVKKYKSIPAFYKSMKDANGKALTWKMRKKLLKEQVTAIKRADESKGEKAVLIILSVLIAIGLITLVAALACNLSCNGSDGAALLVLILGVGAIILLLGIVLRSINRKKRIEQRKQKIDSEKPSHT